MELEELQKIIDEVIDETLSQGIIVKEKELPQQQNYYPLKHLSDVSDDDLENFMFKGTTQKQNDYEQESIKRSFF